MDCRLATSGVSDPAGPCRRRGIAVCKRFVACGVVCLLILAGCQTLRERAARHSAECSDLCSQAATAHETGRYDEARQLLDQARRQRPEDTEVRLRLAEMMWQVGRHDEALEEFSSLAHESRSDVKLLSRYATALCETGQIQEADVWAQSALTVDPLNAEALLVRARCAAQRADYSASLAAYHELLQVSPDHADALLGMAQVQIARATGTRGPRPAEPAAASMGFNHRAARSRMGARPGICRHRTLGGRRPADGTGNRTTGFNGRRLVPARDGAGPLRPDRRFQCQHQHALQLDDQHAGARQLSQELANGSSAGGVKPAAFQGEMTPARRTAFQADETSPLR